MFQSDSQGVLAGVVIAIPRDAPSTTLRVFPLPRALRAGEEMVLTFASEAEERVYWERADSGADLDWRRAKRARLLNLQPSTTAISLRLPVSWRRSRSPRTSATCPTSR